MKQKNSAQQYAHYEPMTSTIRSENSVTGMSAGENSPIHGPSSSGNNSDSPVD